MPGRNELKWRRVPREQQLDAGQSILRYRLMPYTHLRLGVQIHLGHRKGNGFIFPYLDTEIERPLRAPSAATQTNSETLHRARARVLFSGKSANLIRNFGKRIGSKDWAGRAAARSGHGLTRAVQRVLTHVELG
ncbi:hypothetical protein B566_EDAN017718 [Ephemera danica]|nr:hypothetical protein B566_EDAN017718 [Ephemera danica]